MNYNIFMPLVSFYQGSSSSKYSMRMALINCIFCIQSKTNAHIIIYASKINGFPVTNVELISVILGSYKHVTLHDVQVF